MHDHWVCTIITMQDRPYVRPLAVSENAHKLLNHMVYFNKICIQVYFNIIYPLAYVTAFFDGRGFAEHHFSRLWSVGKNAHSG